MWFVSHFLDDHKSLMAYCFTALIVKVQRFHSCYSDVAEVHFPSTVHVNKSLNTAFPPILQYSTQDTHSGSDIIKYILAKLISITNTV